MIREVTDKEKDLFNKVATHPLQSWEWGEFRKATGNDVRRFGVFDDKKLISSFQLTLHKVPGTRYKVGALIKGPAPTQEILTFLHGFARKENIIFIKMEPNLVPKNEAERKKYIKLLTSNGAVEGKRLFTTTTFWIDLTKTEEELLSSFHKKTRYNIRVAQRHGVTVKVDHGKEAFQKYIDLMRETVNRQQFYAHTEKYHRLMWKHLHTNISSNPIAHLLTVRYQGEILTTWILFSWNNFLYYPYGASTDRHKNVMANNLMMWEAIKFGKKLKLKTFDLWGREEGKGFTPFKEGYNPEVVSFLGTWDLVTSPFYTIYQFADKLRWFYLRSKTKFGITKPRF